MSLLHRGLLAAPVVVLALAASAATASADTTLATCNGAQTTTYSPGLTLTTHTTNITVSGQLGPCVAISDLTLTSGTYGSAFTRDRSCLDPLGASSGTRTFHWSNGNTSTFSYNSTSTHVTGATVDTLRGTITAGEFAGATATQVTTLVDNLVDCLTPGGMTEAGGETVLTIVELT